MATSQRASRMSPKSARRLLLVAAAGLFAGALAMGTQFGARWSEAKAYDAAPVCSEGEAARGDSNHCRLVTQAPFAEVQCPSQQRRSTCDFAFRVPVGGTQKIRWTTLPFGLRSRFRPGDAVRIELFQGFITQVAVDGDTLQSVRSRAVSFMVISGPIALLLALGLVWLAYRKPSDSAVEP